MKATFSLVTLFLCLTAKYVSSIKCYKCTSDTDESCSDQYYFGKTSGCPASECITFYTVGFSLIRSRSCGREGNNIKEITAKLIDGREYGMSKDGVTMYWKTCDSDLCNGGLEPKLRKELETDLRKRLHLDEYSIRMSKIDDETINRILRNNEVVYRSNAMCTCFMVLFCIFIDQFIKM